MQCYKTYHISKLKKTEPYISSNPQKRATTTTTKQESEIKFQKNIDTFSVVGPLLSWFLDVMFTVISVNTR